MLRARALLAQGLLRLASIVAGASGAAKSEDESPESDDGTGYGVTIGPRARAMIAHATPSRMETNEEDKPLEGSLAWRRAHARRESP
jgi:hypothetical protein